MRWARYARNAIASSGFGGVVAAALLWVLALVTGQFMSGLDGLVFSLMIILGVVPAILFGFLPILILGGALVHRAGWLALGLTGAAAGAVAAVAANAISELSMGDATSFLMMVPFGSIAMITFWHLEKVTADG
jgi:hypothetical protein